MQPLVHARETDNYPFSSKENYNRKHIRRGRNCNRQTSSLTRLNDVLRKTLLKEAKQNARSSDLVLSSERAPKSKPTAEPIRRKRFLFHERLLMTLVIYQVRFRNQLKLGEANSRHARFGVFFFLLLFYFPKPLQDRNQFDFIPIKLIVHSKILSNVHVTETVHVIAIVKTVNQFKESSLESANPRLQAVPFWIAERKKTGAKERRGTWEEAGKRGKEKKKRKIFQAMKE